jgi:hypothetical protein
MSNSYRCPIHGVIQDPLPADLRCTRPLDPRAGSMEEGTRNRIQRSGVGVCGRTLKFEPPAPRAPLFARCVSLIF